jgi:hypothetical protein
MTLPRPQYDVGYLCVAATRAQQGSLQDRVQTVSCSAVMDLGLFTGWLRKPVAKPGSQKLPRTLFI